MTTAEKVRSRQGVKTSGRPGAVGIIAYTIAVPAIAVLQTTFSARFPLFGASPSLLLALTLAASMFNGAKTGAVIGLYSGFILEALGGTGVSLLPLMYTLTGWFSGVIIRKNGFEPKKSGQSLAVWTLLLLSGCGIGMVITLVSMFLSLGRFNILSSFPYILLPEAAATFLRGFITGPVFILLTYRKRRNNQLFSTKGH